MIRCKTFQLLYHPSNFCKLSRSGLVKAHFTVTEVKIVLPACNQNIQHKKTQQKIHISFHCKSMNDDEVDLMLSLRIVSAAHN